MTLLGGHAVSAVLFALNALGLFTLHFTIVAGLLAAVSAFITVVFSLVTKPASADQLARFTFHAADSSPSATLRWWQDYRLQSALLLVLAILMLLAHW
jgi:SSS family solute:Na+ symporter